MRYKKPSLDALLGAIQAETLAARASGDVGRHLGYVHAMVHEIEYRLCRFPEKDYGDEKVSAIERAFRKLEYE